MTTRQGPEVGKYGTQRVFSTTNPNQITGLTEAGKKCCIRSCWSGGIAGIEALKPGPVDIQQELTELQIDPDRLSGSLFDPIKKPEEPKKEPPKVVGFDTAKISNVLSDEKFDAFLNALAGTLSTIGSQPQGKRSLAAQALQADKFRAYRNSRC